MASAIHFLVPFLLIEVSNDLLLVDLPSRLLASKRENGQRMLAGSNAEEGSMFVPQNLTNVQHAVTDWLATLHLLMSTDDLYEAVDLYLPLNKELDHRNVTFATSGFKNPSIATMQSTAVGSQSLVDTFKSATTYICPSYWLVDAWSCSGSESKHLSSWKYQHSVVPALHASDNMVLSTMTGSSRQLK